MKLEIVEILAGESLGVAHYGPPWAISKRVFLKDRYMAQTGPIGLRNNPVSSYLSLELLITPKNSI